MKAPHIEMTSHVSDAPKPRQTFWKIPLRIWLLKFVMRMSMSSPQSTDVMRDAPKMHSDPERDPPDSLVPVQDTLQV